MILSAEKIPVELEVPESQPSRLSTLPIETASGLLPGLDKNQIKSIPFSDFQSRGPNLDESDPFF